MRRSFSETERGWLRAYPPDAAIERAKRLYERQSAVRRDRFVPPDRDYRWAGFLFEAAVELWLREESIPYRHNGGADDLPDFVVGRRGIGAKVRNGAPMDGLRLLWPVEQSLPTDVIFGLYDPSEIAVYIVGALRRGRFTAKATRLPAGAEIAPGVEARVANYAILAEQLDRPLTWIQNLYVDEIQHRAA